MAAETQPNEFLQALIPETVPESAPPTPEPETEPPAEVSQPPETEASTGSLIEPPEPAGDEPQTLKQFLESKELDAKALFATTKGGKTISELMDKGEQALTLDADRQAFETERATFNANRAATISQFDALLAIAEGGELTPDKVQAYQGARSDFLQQEQRNLTLAIPEWTDAGVKESDVRQMVEAGARFRVSPAILSGILNHELMQMLHHYVKQEARVNELIAQSEAPKPKGVKSAAQPDARQPAKKVPEGANEYVAALFE